MAKPAAPPRASPPEETLSLFGQVTTARATFLEAFQRARTFDDLVPLLRLDDNFTATYEAGGHVWIVNSLYSFSSYFYARTSAGFLHGDTLHALAQRGPIDLAWNHEAIGDFFGHLHLIADETLVRGIQVVPFGTIVHWDGARLEVRSFSAAELADPLPAGRPTEDVLIDLFLEALRANPSRPLLTSSSGLDSRVNLAGMLHLGLRPELAVTGQPDATDVVVVKAMAQAFSLRVNHVQLGPQAYLDAATDIARATNGLKPLDHWHTHAFAARCGYSLADRVVTGTNGEHVRGVGFDYGALALSLDALSRRDHGLLSRPALRRVYAARTRRALPERELSACHPDLARYYGGSRQLDRMMATFPDLPFVWQCDAWVLGQRRRAFQALGLKLFGMSFGTYSPFMRRRWIDAGWHLDLGWRLGSRWHRYAVERLCPRLLDFPEEKERERMLRRPRPLYWVPAVKRRFGRTAVPYVDYGELLRRPDIVGLLVDHASELSDFMPRSVVAGIADEQLRTGRRGRIFGMLAGMAVWRASMRSAAATRVAS